jgi:hypothetical protein
MFMVTLCGNNPFQFFADVLKQFFADCSTTNCSTTHASLL